MCSLLAGIVSFLLKRIPGTLTSFFTDQSRRLQADSLSSEEQLRTPRGIRIQTSRGKSRKSKVIIIGASLSEPLLDELAGAMFWYIYIYIYHTVR